MILIAGAASGGAAVRWQYPDPRAWFVEPKEFGEPSYGITSLIDCSAWFLLSFTSAWVILRLRGPRPVRRRFFSQPGVQAALALMLALPLWHFQRAGDFLPQGWKARDLVEIFAHYDELGLDLARAVGPMIAAIWIATSLAGRRRAEAHWIDRLGRGLGWSWIALWLANGLSLIIEGTSKK